MMAQELFFFRSGYGKRKKMTENLYALYLSVIKFAKMELITILLKESYSGRCLEYKLVTYLRNKVAMWLKLTALNRKNYHLNRLFEFSNRSYKSRPLRRITL